jgi:hypothetical protein
MDSATSIFRVENGSRIVLVNVSIHLPNQNIVFISILGKYAGRRRADICKKKKKKKNAWGHIEDLLQ